MGAGARVIHIVRGDDLVLDAEVVEGEDVLCRSTFESVEVFHCKKVFVPLQFEAGPFRDESLQVRLV